MRAAQFTKYGPPEVVNIVDLPKPTPGPGEVLIRVATTSITAADWRLRAANPFMIRLFFGLRKPKFNILGSEFAGTIEATGAGVTTLQPGMRVCGVTDLTFGAHAEYVVQPSTGTIAEIPDGVEMESAAVLAFGGLTALHFLRDFDQVRPGERVLIIGAGGSVGSAAVQLANHYGAQVSAMASGARQSAISKLGIDTFFDYTKTDFSEIHQRFDLIFDASGKIPFSRCRKLLKPEGRYLTAGMQPLLPVYNLWNRLRGDRRRGRSGYSKHDGKSNDLRFLIELLAAGKFQPIIEKRFQFDDIQTAHALAESEHKPGNLTLHMS